MFARRSLPGVRIETAPLLPPETLPRMDVAVFVGFAQRGPLHCPVVIESVAGFEKVFGSDAPLAWDPQTGSRITAYLGPAVRAFFANGGRRCWVTRAAWTQAQADLTPDGANLIRSQGVARANGFAVPGVLCLAKDGKTLLPAQMQARSAGSWSDDLRVSTACGLAGFPIELEWIDRSTGDFGLQTSGRCAAGDLIRFDTAGVSHFAVVQAMSPSPRGGMTVHARLAGRFESVADLTGAAGTLPDGGPVTVGHSGDGRLMVTCRMALDGVPAVGQWLGWTTGDQNYWMAMAEVSARTFAGGRADVVAVGPVWRVLPTNVLCDMPRFANILTLDLQVTGASQTLARLDRIGLTPGHPQAWWRQFPDDLFYRASGDKAAETALDPAPDRTFPLAVDPDEVQNSLPMAWLPLAVATGFGPAMAPTDTRLPPLHRDGLLAFDARLFVDPDLGGNGLATQQLEADRLRYLAEPTRRLFGVHAALSTSTAGGFPEATLLAVPDAVHVGWTADIQPDWSAPVADDLVAQPGGGTFTDCASRPLIAPDLFAPAAAQVGQVVVLRWTFQGIAEAFVLQEAAAADFSGATDIRRGPVQEHQFLVRKPHQSYFRVAAIAAGVTGLWSAPARINMDDAGATSLPVTAFAAMERQRLLTIHRQIVLAAAASADLFAVLSLPRHFDADAAIVHANALRDSLGETGTDSAGAFVASHGAMYHPWIVSRAAAGNDTTVRPFFCPPDGYTTGVMASRSSLRGAWLAPANVPLRDAVGLWPAIPDARRANLQDAQVNLYRDEPRGILVLDADTLSRTNDRRPLNVRRLLILLRRLALRRGAAFVFEPNGAELRRSVARAFTILLTDLHRRGAFAGATTAESFKINAGEALDAHMGRDLGRFLVELRVAPALPLSFLTVRLAQNGERLSVVEEL